jgi:hypothetical protein
MQAVAFDNPEHQEICTQFGLTAFLGQVLENLLLMIILGNSKVQGTAATAEEFDELETTLKKKGTLGSLVKQVRAECDVPADTELLITAAVEKRNLLIHHFFRDHAFDVNTSDGRQKMINELHEMQRLFLASKVLSDKLLTGLCTAMGITKEMLQAEVEELRRQT